MKKKEIIESIISDKINHKYQIESEKNDYIDKLYANYGELSDINKEIRKLTFEIAKSETEKKDVSEFKAKIADLKTQEKEFFKKMNIDLNAKFRYDCEKCSDTGYLNGGFCDCVKTELEERLFKESNLGTLAKYKLNYEFPDFFKESKQNKEISYLYNYFRKYAENFPDNELNNILLLGQVGVGKTAIISALCGELIKKGHTVLYMTAFMLHNLFLNYHTAPVDEKFAIIRPFLDTDFLFIDDLGTEPVFKNVTLEYLFTVLDTRMVGGKSFATATNLDLNNLLDRYGERIFSRITNKRCTLIRRLNGDNMRLNINK